MSDRPDVTVGRSDAPGMTVPAAVLDHQGMEPGASGGTALDAAPPTGSPIPPSGEFSAGLMSKLKLESLLLTASYGLTALVGVGFWAVAARTVPPSVLGGSTAVISAFTAAAVIGATGIANAFLAMIPIADAARGRLLLFGYTIVGLACLVTGTVAGVIAGIALPVIGSPVQTGVTVALTSVLWGMFVVQDSVLVAFGKLRWLLSENIPVSILKVSILPVLAATFGKGSHPVVVATIVPSVLAVIVITGVVIPRLVRTTEAARTTPEGTEPVSAGDWMTTHRREFELFAMRDGAASAMNLGLFMFLPFLVTAAADKTQGAVFALSLQISNAMDLFTAGVGVTLTTTVATDHGAGPSAARMMWKRLARIVGGVALLVVAGSPLLLWAFGPEYLKEHGWYVVVILALGSLLRTTFEVWTALLRALRRTAVLLAWTSLTSAVLLTAVIIGAESGGAVGAAIGVTVATLLSSTVGALGLLGRIGNRVPRVLRNHAGPSDTRQSWPWTGYEPAEMSEVVEHATYFGDPDRPRFGWLSVPESGHTALGVVLCPPVGEEARSTHRTFRRLGSELARRGIVALRVDYDGTGDSAGAQDEPARVAAWQASITDAARHLRSLGITDVAVAGMRIGATLAATVAADGGFSSVVLWDPCTSGRTFIREGQALHALGEHVPEEAHNGDVHTPGFRFNAATVAELRTVSLAALPAEPWCDRMLVLTRSGSPIAGVPGSSLQGEHIEWDQAFGQLELVGVEPNQALTPITSIERIADWLSAGVDPAQEMAFTVDPVTEALVHDPHSGTVVRERIMALGPDRIFGIATEPAEPARNAPWVIMPNVAIELHIGPGRCWVDFARSWAALGMRCVRFDQSGLGDSPLRAEQREDRIFDPLWLRDFPDVYDGLDSGAAPVAAFGLRSAAYASFEGGMRRPLDAVYAVSPRVSVAEMAIGEASYSPDRIAARPFVRPLARLYQRDTMAAWGFWRLYRQLAVWHAPMASALALLRTGADLRILADRKDAEGYREVFWWSVVRRRASVGTGRYHLRVDAEIDHALMTQRAQRITFDDATRYFCERYGLEADVSECARSAVSA